MRVRFMNTQAFCCLVFLFFYIDKVSSQEFSPAVKEFIEIHDSVFAITNVKIIDGTGAPVKDKQDILIIGERINSIGPTSKIAIPKNAMIIDGSGKTLIPGLIMCHEHLFYVRPNSKAIEMANIFPKMYLAGGVTTMRTAAAYEAHTELAVKNAIDRGKIIGPEMDLTTPLIAKESTGIGRQTVFGNESLEQWIDYWLHKGITSVKVYNDLTKEDCKRVVKKAHARNTKVAGHLCSITYREAADLGIDCIEHGFMFMTDFNPSKKENVCDRLGMDSVHLALGHNSGEIIKLMKHLIEKDVTIDYTPNCFEPFTNREVVPGGGLTAMAPFLKEQIQTIYNARINKDSMATRLFANEMKRIVQFYKMGGKLIVGTDPTTHGRTIAGYSNQHLIELLIETGFTLEETIKIATLNGGIYLQRAKETGSIEVGKKADLVLINGDLQKNIAAIRNMEIVFKNGIGFNSKKIFDSVKEQLGAD